MIQIRNSLFETNSSSVNTLVIPKDASISIPERVSLFYDNYSSWRYTEDTDTLNYAYSMCVDRGDCEILLFLNYLRRKGVKEIETHPTTGVEEWNIDYDDSAIPLKDIFGSEKVLDLFCFGSGSMIYEGNDNDSDNLYKFSKNSYDLNKFYVIER